MAKVDDETGCKNRLAEARKARGLTQVQLAEKCGMNQSQISYIEKGRRGTFMRKWREIASVLEVDLDWLLPGESIEQERLVSELSNQALPFGLRELIEDSDLIKGLKITSQEWSALKSLKSPENLTKDGYVGVLFAIRNGSYKR